MSKKRRLSPKDFIVSCDENYEKAVSLGYDIRMEESQILEWMQMYADYVLELAQNTGGNFTNGTISLSWQDVDHVRVHNHRIHRYAVIQGGDLEGMLNALIVSTPYKVEPEFNTDKNY